MIRLFKHFAGNEKYWHGGPGGGSPTVCWKFYGNDGLHFNSTGSELLGALISRFLFKAFKEKQTAIPKAPSTQKPCGSPPSTAKLESVHGISSPPRIVFAGASSPPPSAADPHHYPPLTDLDIVVGYGEKNLSTPVLTGFSDAVTKKVTRFPQAKEKRKCMLDFRLT